LRPLFEWPLFVTGYASGATVVLRPKVQVMGDNHPELSNFGAGDSDFATFWPKKAKKKVTPGGTP
jgi:hypothetical protein